MKFRTVTYSPVFVGTCEQYNKIVLYTSVEHPGELFIACDDGELWSLEHEAEIYLRLDPVLQIQHLCVKSSVWRGAAVGNHLSLMEEEPLVVPV